MDHLNGLIPSNNTYGNRWYNCYWGNTQLNAILDNTANAAVGNQKVRWAARIWQNFLWLYNVDSWEIFLIPKPLRGFRIKGKFYFPNTTNNRIFTPR